MSKPTPSQKSAAAAEDADPYLPRQEQVQAQAQARPTPSQEPPELTLDLFPALQLVSRALGGSKIARSTLYHLPLRLGKLDEANLVDASKRLHLTLRQHKADLKKLKRTDIPALCVPEEENTLMTQPFVILKHHGDYVTVAAHPDEKPYTVHQDELGPIQSCYIFAPIYFFDQRSSLLDLPTYKAWFKGPLLANKRFYIAAAVAGVVINLATVSISLFVMAVYDRIIPNRAYDSLIALIIGILILVMFDFTLKNLRAALVDVAARRFDVNVGSRVFGHILALKPSSRPQSAGATANLVREFDAVRDFFTSASLVTVADLPFVLLFLAVIAQIAGVVALVPATLALLVIGIGFAIQRPLQSRVKELFKLSGQKSAFIHEVAAGMDTVKSVNGQAWARRRYETLLKSSVEANERIKFFNQLQSSATAGLMQLTTIGVMAVGVFQIVNGNITTGALIASTILSGRALAPLGQVVGLMAKWNHVRASLTAVDRLMQAPSELDGDQLLLAPDRISGHIAIQDISFTYPPTTQTQPPCEVFKGANMVVNPGEFVGIIGDVGRGKSTLLKLIVNLYTLNAGHIMLDGLDIRSFDPADLRRHVGYSGQESILFFGSVRDNILMGDAWIDDNAVIQASRAAGLDYLLRHSGLGLAAPVGERGEQLSGGQRLAVGIARAVVRNPQILLLDEPTAAFDPTVERIVFSRLRTVRKGKTTLIVSHRQSLIPYCDRVFRVEKMRISELNIKIPERAASTSSQTRPEEAAVRSTMPSSSSIPPSSSSPSSPPSSPAARSPLQDGTTEQPTKTPTKTTTKTSSRPAQSAAKKDPSKPTRKKSLAVGSGTKSTLPQNKATKTSRQSVS